MVNQNFSSFQDYVKVKMRDMEQENKMLRQDVREMTNVVS